MKRIIKSMAFRMTAKKIDESQLSIDRIFVKEDSVQYFNLSTNPIISFFYDGKLYYFRECPKVYNLKQFFKTRVNDFFSSLKRIGICKEHFKQQIPICIHFSTEQIELFRKYVENRMTDIHFLRMISKADLISEKIGFSIWQKQTYDNTFFSKFGLYNLPFGTSDIAVYFLWCMRSAAGNYRMRKIVKGKNYSFFSATKAMASYIVAEELGCSHLVTGARWCMLEIGNRETKFGIMSSSAPGSRMVDSNVCLDGNLQRELMNLNVLDMICFQVDHGPNNYNVFRNEEDELSVCAFDNDNPLTFFPINSINHSKVGSVPFVNKNGIIIRPYFDSELKKRLDNLDCNLLKARLKPLLNTAQIKSLISRIKKIREAVETTQSVNQFFVIEPGGWNRSTLEKELSGEYGKTYLVKVAELEESKQK